MSYFFFIARKLSVSHEGELKFFGCIGKTNHKRNTFLKNLYFNQLVSIESGLVRCCGWVFSMI